MKPKTTSETLLSRRSMFYAGGALLSTAIAQPSGGDRASTATSLKVAIFSKHLQFLHGGQLAQRAADLGFDGIDLTVRNGGHVDPARVRQDLPPLVAAIREHGLEVPMITTGISDTETSYTDEILSTAAELGIHHYRWAGFKYTEDRPITKQLEYLRPRVAKLAALNARYGVCAMYHTHSGVGLVGAPIWDLHELLNGLDPRAVGVNYDIGHATVEGGLGGWIDSFRVTCPYVRGIAVKDFLWEQDARGNWQPTWKPLGEGMVHLHQFFDMVAAAHFSGPLQLHFEYPLGGAEHGKVPGNNEEVFDAMKRDLAQLRSYLHSANLA